MYWNSEIKAELIARHSPRHDPKDTGSPEAQIALLTYRIQEIANHLKENPKDFSAQRGLFRLVGQRKRLLAYLKRKDIERYRTIISALGLRA
jgi:small subunit ribosomal protein S15